MEIKTNISIEDIAIYLAHSDDIEQANLINKFVEYLKTVCNSHEFNMQVFSIANNLNDDSITFIKNILFFIESKELKDAAK